MDKNKLTRAVLSGKIFIYPTDTIYGLGCDATNKESVDKIREIKKRDNKPFSVIAPSFEWIEENCLVDTDLSKYLPGPYTIILKKKNPSFLIWVSNTDSIGVRVPDNSFCKKIQKTGVPFITTSVNLAGEPFATKISEIKEEIKNKVDFIIDIGELNGKPSTLVIGGKEVKR